MEKHSDYLNESELIDGFLAGSRSAYQYLVEKYQDRVFRTILGFVHNKADAEDITQEVFIGIFQSVHKFRRESGLSTWIYRIAVNKAINYNRSLKSQKIMSFFDLQINGERVINEGPAAPEEYNADDDLNRSEYAAAIKKSIDRLPYAQRTAFILSKYDDLTYQEIAAVMKCSVSSVESLLFRAKKNLQKSLYSFYKKNHR